MQRFRPSAGPLASGAEIQPSSQWGLVGILVIAVALLLVGSVSGSASGKAAMKANGLIAFDNERVTRFS